MESNKISIIVPVYNVEKYLSRCLDSLLNQTLKDIEIICVNDGSTDESLKILESYAEKDNRIKIVNKENGGLSSARNEGLKYVTSDYVGFVDSDDWIEPDTYELALSAVQKNNVDFVSWGAKIVLDDDIKEETPSIASARNYHNLKLIGYHNVTDSVLTKTSVTVWNKLFKMQIIRDNNLIFPNGLIYEDNEFFLKYAIYCQNAYYIDKYLYNYLQRTNSIIGKMCTKNKALDYLKVYENIYTYYTDKNLLEKHRKLISDKFNAIMWNSYTHCWDKKLVKKKLRILARNLDNNILQNENINLIKKNKFYKINNLNASKLSCGCKLLGFEETREKLIFKLLGIKISLKKQNIYSKKKENCKKIVKILGIKLTFKDKKAILNNKFNDIYYKLNQQKISFDKNIENTLALTKYFMEDKLISDAEKNKFRGRYPDFDTKIKDAVKNFDEFYFYPNVGNMGDGIIAEAEFQILNNCKYNYKIVDNYSNKVCSLEEYNLVYGGGGLFVKYWNYQKVLDIFKDKNLKKCVVLPSSFYECDDVLECFDERFTVFCREAYSYNYCISKNKRAKFIQADDMAFSLNLDLQEKYDVSKIKDNMQKLSSKDFAVLTNVIYPKIRKLYQNVQAALKVNTIINSDKVRIGYLLRTDAEKKSDKVDFPSVDLSKFANSPCTDSGVVGLISRVFIETLNSFDVIITDRLHIGLVSSLLGKEVYLLDNSYKKVSGIYEYSMQSYKNTHIVSSLNEVCIDNLKTKKSKADVSIINNPVNIEKIFNIYLSKLKYEKTIKDTIWSIK
ncbi:predicted glycosyltransferase [Clostridium sp. CAG:729]|nr:predicted glycosyltransferase [Clostridium sp. CAG:729]